MSIVVERTGADLQGIISRFYTELILDSSELLDQVGEQVVFPSILKGFDTEGRKERWADLSPRTQRERRAEGYGEAHPILERTGELKRSSTEKNGYPGGVYELGKTELNISNYLEKASVLHFGDGKIPAREFFTLQDEDTKLTVNLVQKYVVNKMAEIIATENKV